MVNMGATNGRRICEIGEVEIDRMQTDGERSEGEG